MKANILWGLNCSTADKGLVLHGFSIFFDGQFTFATSRNCLALKRCRKVEVHVKNGNFIVSIQFEVPTKSVLLRMTLAMRLNDHEMTWLIELSSNLYNPTTKYLSAPSRKLV